MHYKKYKSILSSSCNMNIYRGCEHGCIYCDSRSKCYQIVHDFEDIEVKSSAPEMLREELLSKREKCIIKTGAMSDPYTPIEKEIMNTRKCLEVIDECKFGIAIQTKSDLILRDLDLFKSIDEHSKATVQMTITTYDSDLCSKIEPNVCNSQRRFEVLKTLSDNGIKTVVWLSPILPFINDTETNVKQIVQACAEANVWGIVNFGFGMTLRDGNREYFYRKLDNYFTGLKQRYHKNYGYNYIVNSPNFNSLIKVFNSECLKYGITNNIDEIFAYLNTYPQDKSQMSLFE